MYSHSPCMNTWRRRCLIAKSTRITPNLVLPRQFYDIVDYLSRPGIEHTKLRSPMHHIADLMKKGIHPFDSGDIVIFMQLKHSSIHHYMYVLCVLYMYYKSTIHVLCMYVTCFIENLVFLKILKRSALHNIQETYIQYFLEENFECMFPESC